MEQFHNDLLVTEEEKHPTVMDKNEINTNSTLLNKVSQKFNIFGGISLIFGSTFALCFYKAGTGINYLIFVIVMVVLLCSISKALNMVVKKATAACYMGAILLGLSTFLTANETLHFLNTVGILLLLDVALLHQIYADDKWDFVKHLGRMFGLLFHCIATIGLPLIDSYHYLGNTKLLKKDRTRNIILGMCIAIPLLWIIVLLLSSADLLFNELTGQFVEFLSSNDIVGVGIMILFGFVACYCIICGSVRREEVDNQKQMKRANPTIAITTMTCLCLVYVLFSGIQVIYLFADGLFHLPQEFTFAEYARQGFFELLFVTGINIVLIFGSTMLFEESKILRILLICMTVCTYIMIASATYRMLLYIGTYHLTFLRLFVLLFLLIDSLVLAGVITSVFVSKFPLFGYCVAVVSTCYILFSLGKPDYLIASYHISHEETLDYEDFQFLTVELSIDAAPIIVPILSDPAWWNKADTDNTVGNLAQPNLWEQVRVGRDNYYEQITRKEQESGFRDFNYSKYLASSYASQYPIK